MVVLDADGRVVQVNPAAGAWWGPSLPGGDAWAILEGERLVRANCPENSTAAGDRERRLSLRPSARSIPPAAASSCCTTSLRTYRLRRRSGTPRAPGGDGRDSGVQVAHQLRTPLAAALLYAGNLENWICRRSPGDSIARKTVERLKVLEPPDQDMLLFARGETLTAGGRGRTVAGGRPDHQTLARGPAASVFHHRSFGGRRSSSATENSQAWWTSLENARHAAGSEERSRSTRSARQRTNSGSSSSADD